VLSGRRAHLRTSSGPTLRTDHNVIDTGHQVVNRDDQPSIRSGEPMGVDQIVAVRAGVGSRPVDKRKEGVPAAFVRRRLLLPLAECGAQLLRRVYIHPGSQLIDARQRRCSNFLDIGRSETTLFWRHSRRAAAQPLRPDFYFRKAEVRQPRRRDAERLEQPWVPQSTAVVVAPRTPSRPQPA
jgi:hypothetical protein